MSGSFTNGINDPVRDIDLNLILVLESLLETNSVGETARQMGLTQSAVSRSLSRLRLQFDDHLFVKTNNRMLPTAKALQLADAVGAIVSLVRERLLPDLSFDPARLTRPIILCLDDMAEAIILPRLMRLLMAATPHCSVRTVPASDANFRSAMEHGAASLAIKETPPPFGEMMQQKLYDEELQVMVHVNADVSDPITAEEYSRLQHIGYMPADGTQFVQPWLDSQAIRRTVAVRSPHVLAIPQIVAQNETMVATLPSQLGKIMPIPNVRMVKTAFALPRMAISQYWHKRFDSEPMNMWLRQQIRTVVSEM